MATPMREPQILLSVNHTQNWTYDAAGNRSSDTARPGAWSYDNLNRMTASPGMVYTNDVLGNRTGKTLAGTDGTTGYIWDDVNRLIGTETNATSNWRYTYRADGMRVAKSKVQAGVTTPI